MTIVAPPADIPKLEFHEEFDDGDGAPLGFVSAEFPSKLDRHDHFVTNEGGAGWRIAFTEPGTSRDMSISLEEARIYVAECQALLAAVEQLPAVTAC
ncbi:Arm DNA-binding domain-containing protein [Agromyces badenianii]|uniref:Arm DNA-binding domain-containing protein n=1 Tax=Agromyces badenianii TaxID=2080742 RepID=UPI000D597E78|nr:Arm DNA-binding domain-containing protein [Agromyces badenianii]PWC05435.1 hypothetical protein DCE94_03950 [Agromyces badenianii]